MEDYHVLMPGRELLEKSLDAGATDFTEEDDFFKEINKEEEIPKTIINFNMGGVKVLEKKDYFIIYIVRHMFYIVPKEHFSDEERAMLIKCFKNAQFIPEK